MNTTNLINLVIKPYRAAVVKPCDYRLWSNCSENKLVEYQEVNRG